MNNKTVQFTCKTCNTQVYRLGSQVNKQDGLCGKCSQGFPQTVQFETLNQVKVETPLDKTVLVSLLNEIIKDYNKQWKEDKPETQSLERFLNKNQGI